MAGENFAQDVLIASQSGRTDEALKLCEEWIRSDPENPEAYWNRGNLFFRMNDFENAMDDYNFALSRSPDHTDLLFNRAVLSGFYMDDFESAKKDFIRLLTLQPGFAEGHFRLGYLYYLFDHPDEASKSFLHAAEANPHYGEAYFFLGLCREACGDIEGAIKAYEKAPTAGFDYAQLYYQMGMARLKAGDYEGGNLDLALSSEKPHHRQDTLESHPCPYYKDERVSLTETLFPSPVQQDRIGHYVESGFSRFANFFFRPICPSCGECIALRVDVLNFHPSKTQRRVGRKNRDLRVEILHRPIIDRERVELFRKYYAVKHGMVEHANIEKETAYRHFGFRNAREFDVYLGDKLIAVSIADEGKDALYASYCYYDTDYMDRSPGVFTVLLELDYARKRNIPYYYMGWYLKDFSEMNYKASFRPCELLQNGHWQPFGERKTQ